MTRRERLVLELSALLANFAALIASWRTPTPPKTTPLGCCPECQQPPKSCLHWR